MSSFLCSVSRPANLAKIHQQSVGIAGNFHRSPSGGRPLPGAAPACTIQPKPLIEKNFPYFILNPSLMGRR
jgi:hypothetical protein